MAIVSLFQKQGIGTEVHSIAEVAEIVVIGALVLTTIAMLTISASAKVIFTWTPTAALAATVILSVLFETEKM